jgi:hypothetical protein
MQGDYIELDDSDVLRGTSTVCLYRDAMRNGQLASQPGILSVHDGWNDSIFDMASGSTQGGGADVLVMRWWG